MQQTCHLLQEPVNQYHNFVHIYDSTVNNDYYRGTIVSDFHVGVTGSDLSPSDTVVNPGTTYPIGVSQITQSDNSNFSHCINSDHEFQTNILSTVIPGIIRHDELPNSPQFPEPEGSD